MKKRSPEEKSMNKFMDAFMKWHDEYYKKYPDENKYTTQHHEFLLQALIVSKALMIEILEKVDKLKKKNKHGKKRTH